MLNESPSSYINRRYGRRDFDTRGRSGSVDPAKALSTAKVSGAPARTPDGQPDLQGVWSFAILTPLERPDDLAGKATLTDQEAAESAQRKEERENEDSREGSGPDADFGKAYNDAWWDFGTKASNQTSLIIDPPNGKLPALAAEGQKRKMARAAFSDK